MIETVTLTGIDENTDPDALVELGRWFPFVELAVLAGTRNGRPRMPGRHWIREWVAKASQARVATAVHLCGAVGHPEAAAAERCRAAPAVPAASGRERTVTARVERLTLAQGTSTVHVGGQR